MGELPVRITGYDGSAIGPADSGITLSIRSERGLTYLLTAPGDLGMARAYVSGDLALAGVHPGDPYEALTLLKDELRLCTPSVAEAMTLLRGLGWDRLRPPAPPPQEALPRWRRVMRAAHSRSGQYRHLAPLRRVERLLRAGTRPSMTPPVRSSAARRHPGAGPGGQ
jgi:cyclopropane-fatty-acyl-phospholipid synthase